MAQRLVSFVEESISLLPFSFLIEDAIKTIFRLNLTLFQFFFFIVLGIIVLLHVY